MGADRAGIVTDNREADPTRGFGSMGEFMQAVYQAEKPGQSIDARLLPGGISAAAPTHFSNEASGYATDPEYAAKLVSVIEQYQLASLDGGA